MSIPPWILGVYENTGDAMKTEYFEADFAQEPLSNGNSEFWQGATAPPNEPSSFSRAKLGSSRNRNQQPPTLSSSKKGSPQNSSIGTYPSDSDDFTSTHDSDEASFSNIDNSISTDSDFDDARKDFDEETAPQRASIKNPHSQPTSAWERLRMKRAAEEVGSRSQHRQPSSSDYLQDEDGDLLDIADKKKNQT